MRNAGAATLAIVSVVALLSACSDGESSSGSSDEARADSARTEDGSTCLVEPDSCSLREVAADADFLIGAAIDSEWIQDPTYAEVLAREFNSVTAEREMKWNELQP
ncbi:MAG: endo-1,4-beta-xylanase, partial [Microthrixaceae bacterium]